MDYAIQHRKNENRDRRNSAIITFLISLLIFIGIFFYQFTKITEKPEEVTTMLINFGDNLNGNQIAEPAHQEGSLSASNEPNETSPEVDKEPVVKEKIITGVNPATSTPKVEKVKPSKKKIVSKPTTTTPTKKKTTKTTKTNSEAGTGDGKGNAAIGNLLKGRGTNKGNQGNDGVAGNAGDPLGGNGNGDSKIGVDRQLISFIPGTMGRGGKQPAHNCSASGTISLSYTVDKAGNVTSAHRSGGTTDACISATSIQWVRKYVKAERANFSSTGTYKISF